MSSADIFANNLDTLKVFLKEFFEKVDFEKNQQTTKLEDLKALRRSPDLLNNVKIGQG